MPSPTKSDTQLPSQHHSPLCLWKKPLFQVGQPYSLPVPFFNFKLFIRNIIPNTCKSINNSIRKSQCLLHPASTIINSYYTHSQDYFESSWIYHFIHNYFSIISIPSCTPLLRHSLPPPPSFLIPCRHARSHLLRCFHWTCHLVMSHWDISLIAILWFLTS